MERLWQATINSWHGLVAIARSEQAFREELVLLVIGIPAAILLSLLVAGALWIWAAAAWLKS